MKLFITSIISIVYFCLSNNQASNDIESVKIGNQVWATKNLDVATFRNGDTIPEAENEEKFEMAGKMGNPAWCYYNGDSLNRDKYGKLYNWYAVNDVRGLAPQGWHIPTCDEWTLLIDYLGGSKIAANKMKSEREWDGDNSSGFNAIPSGCFSFGSFSDMGTECYLWSACEGGSKRAWSLIMIKRHGWIGQFKYNKLNGFAIRCIHD